MIDVVTVGNGILDAFLLLREGKSHCRINTQTKELCVKAGEKILLDGCEFHLGGNACNVAVGLARLGFQTSLMAELADDEFSEKIINGLKTEHVNLDLVQRKAGQSSFTVGLNFNQERTLFVEHRERLHNFQFSGVQTRWMYLTSLGNKWEHVYEAAAEYKKQTNVLLACNPGSVQLQAGSHTFSYLFPLMDILFLSKTEAEKIIGQPLPLEELLVQLKALGPRVVCLTDGKKGASAITEDGHMHHQDSAPATVVEVTGAGDSFAAGFLGAILLEKSVQEALVWGITNASSVIEHIGSQPGLLTRSALEEKVKEENNL